MFDALQWSSHLVICQCLQFSTVGLDYNSVDKHLPLVLVFEKPKAVESGSKNKKTITIAKRQAHFKGDAIAKYDALGQRGVEDREMHMKKPNEKIGNDRRSKREGAFTPDIFFSIRGDTAFTVESNRSALPRRSRSASAPEEFTLDSGCGDNAHI